MSKPSARKPTVVTSGYETSIGRVVIAAALVVLGIAWIAVYYMVARDAALAVPGAKQPSNPLPFMADLEKWNYLIGFVLSSPDSPSRRTRRPRWAVAGGWSSGCSAAS